MTSDFWERCVKADCVVLPVKVYSAYNAVGNLDDSTFVGVRYAALPFDNCAVAPEYWFMIDEQSTRLANLFDSPLEALQAWERSEEKRRGREK